MNAEERQRVEGIQNIKDDECFHSGCKCSDIIFLLSLIEKQEAEIERLRRGLSEMMLENRGASMYISLDALREYKTLREDINAKISALLKGE